MQEKLLSYENGVKTWFSSEGGTTGTWHFRHEYDDVNLDWNRSLANDPSVWKKGVKSNMAHYANIPDSILVKWHAEGLDIKDPKALFAQVNKREWSYLKTTNKIHVVKA